MSCAPRRIASRSEKAQGFHHPLPTARYALFFSMPVHITSEIGRLRGVVVHSPGVELDAVTPGNREEYLYDDVIDSEAARKEHQRFVAILERFTPVYQVRDLLADILANDDARQLLI